MLVSAIQPSTLHVLGRISTITLLAVSGALETPLRHTEAPSLGKPETREGHAKPYKLSHRWRRVRNAQQDQRDAGAA